MLFRSVNLSNNSASVGVDGLDTGVLAASTWYSVWVISDGTNVKSLLSLSATAPTMPAGYTFKARVGWIRTDGTANKFPLSFVQAERDVRYKPVAASNLLVNPTLANGVSGTFTTTLFTPTAISLAPLVPPTASAVLTNIVQGSVASAIAVAPGVVFAGFATTNPPPLFLDNGASAPLGVIGEFLLESLNLYYAATAASNFAQILGWKDNIYGVLKMAGIKIGRAHV